MKNEVASTGEKRAKLSKNQTLVLQHMKDKNLTTRWMAWYGYRFFDADQATVFVNERGITRTVEALQRRGLLEAVRINGNQHWKVIA